MIIRISAILLFLLSACTQEPGPPVSIVAAKIFAPMPGGTASVAYFTIENRSDKAITVTRIDSPEYSDVQMHETILEDGISRMRALKFFQVNPASTLEFAPGGKHVMLMKPIATMSSGSPVTLEIHYDTGLLIVSATLRDRNTAQ